MQHVLRHLGKFDMRNNNQKIYRYINSWAAFISMLLNQLDKISSFRQRKLIKNFISLIEFVMHVSNYFRFLIFYIF